MINNIWRNAVVCCGNPQHGNENIPMQIKQGPHSVFYACPRYANKYEGGQACGNRISPETMDIIFKKLSEKMEENDDINLTGYEFGFKTIFVKVVKHLDTQMIIKVFDKKTIR